MLRACHRCHHQQRAVGPRPEALRDQVVGLAGGGVLGEVALIGEAEAQPQRRRGQHEQHHRPAHREQPRPGLDDPAQPVPDGFAQRFGVPVSHSSPQRVGGGSERPGHEHDNRQRNGDEQQSEASAESEQRDADQRRSGHAPDPGGADPVPEKADGGRQQRDRSGHHQSHGGGRGQAQPGHERQAHEQQTQQRHHYGGPGEDHRSARRIEGRGGGLLRSQAATHPFPVAGDDEQGVVDTHAYADHDPQSWGELRDGHNVAEDDHAGRAGAHADQGGPDGHAHGHHRAHRQDQHEHRERESDGLGLRRCPSCQPRAADLHLDAVGSQTAGVDQAVYLQPYLGGFVGGRVGADLEVGVCDAASVRAPEGDAAAAAGIVGGGHVDALEGLDLVEQVRHGGPDGRVVHALLRSEHDGAGDRGAEIAEVRAEDVGSAGALGVGGSGRRAVGRPESAGHPCGHNDDQQPGSQDPPRMPVAEARQRRVHNRAFPPRRLLIRRRVGAARMAAAATPLPSLPDVRLASCYSPPGSSSTVTRCQLLPTTSTPAARRLATASQAMSLR